MFKVKQTKRFKKEYRLMGKRGKDMGKIDLVIRFIARGTPLPAEYLEHPLHGPYEGWTECHVEPNWLLVYKFGEDTVLFDRTGTHSDLF
jgi:mRNA interferase YafQ